MPSDTESGWDCCMFEWQKGGNAEFGVRNQARPPWKIDIPLRLFVNSLPTLPPSTALGGMLLSDELVELQLVWYGRVRPVEGRRETAELRHVGMQTQCSRTG